MIRKRAEERLAGVELLRDLDARALKTLAGRLQTRVVPAGPTSLSPSWARWPGGCGRWTSGLRPEPAWRADCVGSAFV